MKEFIKVVCTDRGEHARLEYDTIVLNDEDGSVETMTVRTAAAPGLDPRIESSIGPKAWVNADDRRDDFEGARRWRWICVVCGRDVVLNEESLRKVAHAYVATGRRVLDISHIPTA